VGIIAICYVVEIFLVRPDWAQIGYHAVIPQFSGASSIVLATGILGATIMPHAIFLHSSLTQNRVMVHEPDQLKRLYQYEIVDVIVAMGVASLVNGAMLIMAASTFFKNGLYDAGTLEAASRTLQPLLGRFAGTVFAISLLASGLSSASVGTMAGQMIMRSFLEKEIPVWIRRIITIVPSMIVILLGLDPSKTLVFSQVVLSFGLPFTIIPLVLFTSNPKIMGVLVNKRITTLLASVIAGIVVILNIFLVVSAFLGR